MNYRSVDFFGGEHRLCGKAALAVVYHHGAVGVYLARDYLLGDERFDIALYKSLQRARAEAGVEALLDYRVHSLFAYLNVYALVLKPLVQLGYHEFYYLAYLLAAQRFVVNYLVEPVEELGAEAAVEQSLYVLYSFGRYAAVLLYAVEQCLRTEV